MQKSVFLTRFSINIASVCLF